MHVTPEAQAVRRLLIAQHRDAPTEGIVDAYLLERTLVLLLGDFSIRAFPIAKVPSLCDMEPTGSSFSGPRSRGPSCGSTGIVRGR